MKTVWNLAFAFLITTPFSSAFGQSIIGTWQVGTNKIGETILDNYVFKADRTFEYRVNSDLGLNRIRAIGGTYNHKGSYIDLNVKYTKEVVGGIVERSQFTIGNDSWTIEGGTLQKRLLTKPTTYSVNIVFYGPLVFAFDEGNKFYKLK